jgi:hypothetical protein
MGRGIDTPPLPIVPQVPLPPDTGAGSRLRPPRRAELYPTPNSGLRGPYAAYQR